MESLTSRIEREIMDYVDRIEEMGGYITALEKGFLQKEVSAAALKYQREIESGKRVIVGVNKYVPEEETEVDTFEHNPRTGIIAVERLRKLKEERDDGRVKTALEKVKETATNDCHLMPVLIEAVKTYATLGEIMGVFREVFGEYREETFLAASME